MPNPRSIATSLSILLAFLLAAFLTQQAISQKGDTGVNHALIIGINDYDHWPKLKSAVKDAEEIARIFTEKYDFKKENVVLLTDNTAEKPTRVTILTYIDKFVNELTAKDNLVVFFSGQSTEDEKGETYWVPKDGRDKTKLTWLKHSELCREFFEAESFKAKNLCILADSFFSRKLIKGRAIPLTTRDLRYVDKIVEMAQKPSREVITFNDQHWDGTKRTQGYGLFTFYIRKALQDNWMKVIDFENLIFTEDAIFSISKIAGAKLARGRLRKAPMEQNGQTVIWRTISPPVVNVVDVFVTPDKGYQGDEFIVQAKTDKSAFEVFVDVAGREHVLDGSGTQWRAAVKVTKAGDVPLKVTAFNFDNTPGKTRSARVSTLKRAAGLVNVLTATVSKKTIWGGNTVRFTATTDSAAKKVALVLKDKRHEMTKKTDTEWVLSKAVEQVGTLDFSMIATNDDGVEGRPKGGIIVVKAPVVEVVELKASPKKGYEDQEFLITAKTDFPAKDVSLLLDGVTYPMEGEGVNWRFKRKLRELGKKKIEVVALNTEGRKGYPASDLIEVLKRPLAVPQIARVDVSPDKPFTDETVTVEVKTTVPAEEVLLKIGDRRIAMEGTATDWRAETRVASIGPSGYSVVARNREGKQGMPMTGEITARKRPLPVPNIADVSVTPDKPYAEDTFAISVKTTAPAEKVFAEIEGKRLPMKGSGTEWKLLTQIANVGTRKFKVIAENKDGKQGTAEAGSVVIAKRPAKAVDVMVADVNPKTGLLGQEYTFKATTSAPAKSVALIIEDKRYAMTGSGKQWTLKKKVEDAGSLDFAMVATNEDGEEGSSKYGNFVIKAPPANVVEVKTSPEAGYAGDEFLITVKTDAPARSVSLEIDGVAYKMEGADRTWRLKRRIADIGSKELKVLATNLEGLPGLSKTASIVTRKREVLVADVATVVVSPVSPGQGFAGDTFLIRATTTEPAEEVFVEIEGQRFAMKGAEKEWTLEQKVEKVGSTPFTVAALNRERQAGKPKTGTIEAKEKPVAIPNVAAVEVTATAEGYVGDTFLIKATTSDPSDKVFVEIEGERFAMEGTGTEWKYMAQVNRLGESAYRVTALNKDGKQGQVKEGVITTTGRPMALVNVLDVAAAPKEKDRNFAGSDFVFTAKTDVPAKGVTLVIGQERYEMTGAETQWTFTRKVDDPGTLVFYSVARNEEDVAGRSKTGELVVAELKERFQKNADGTITDKITGETKPRFVDNDDGTVTDLATNLMWLKSPKQVSEDFEAAQRYCQELTIKEYDGWRLATLNEWMDLIDTKQENPALPKGHPFVNLITHTGYWTKTKHKFGPLYVYQINLWRGKAGYLKKDKAAIVWPVRYAAQVQAAR